MNQGLHSNWALSWCMDDGILESDVVCAWETSNSLKSVWVCLDEVFLSIELFQVGEVLLYLSAFCCGFVLCVFQQMHTAQLSSTIPNFEHDESPKIAGPGVSAMYHWVCSLLMMFFPFGFQSIAVSNVPYCLMVDPL